MKNFWFHIVYIIQQLKPQSLHWGCQQNVYSPIWNSASLNQVKNILNHLGIAPMGLNAENFRLATIWKFHWKELNITSYLTHKLSH